MAKRKPSKASKVSQPEQEVETAPIEDLTELGADVEGLQEVEVTEVESIIEDQPELIEEEACETESDQSEDEEKVSKNKSESEKKSLDESELKEKKQPSVRSVKATTPKENPSLVQEKTSKIETEFSQNAPSQNPKKQEISKPKTTRVAPTKANADGAMRSTFGIFHR